MNAFYNDIDPKACAWLRELANAGEITAGHVDSKSITDLTPNDFHEFERVHFFAGIGGWDHALNIAGWQGPVWTASLPCQPFSVAGKRRGTADERHLWPVFRDLVEQCRPPIIFGEQVASKDGRLWLSGVFADLEALGYSRAASDLCAAGVGAPHIRQRLYWVAYPNGGKPGNGELQPGGQHGQQQENGGAGGLEHTEGNGRIERRAESSGRSATSGRGISGLGDARSTRGEAGLPASTRWGEGYPEIPDHGSDRRAGPWRECNYLTCTDGKARLIKPSIQPLAHGVSGRVGLLRGYGNAIVPPLAAEFIQASYEAISATTN